MLSCSKDVNSPSHVPWEQGNLHEEIVLGSRLENPYSIENVKSAVAALYSAQAAEGVIYTDYYVRFLPSGKSQLDQLKRQGITMVDHPIDYEIVRDGDYYHDPQIAKDHITWQYAVVPKDFVFPAGIRYEIIQRCFLAENSPTKASDGIDWDAVEAQSFRMTGNGSMLQDVSGTKAAASTPSGRITIVDSEFNGGQPIGVSGVKVECNVFVKFSSAYTDRDGYYQIPKKFSTDPRYRLVFTNEKGFSIGLNTILYRGSVSGLGKQPVSGVDVAVTQDSERKLFRRCVANNAAYDFYMRCQKEDLDLPAPPSDISMWMFDSLAESSTVMLHHGTVLDIEISNIYYKIAAWVVQLMGPDITLGTKDSMSYSQIYSTVIHELAHACHYGKVGNSYWNKFITYIITCAIKGANLYGDSSLENSGLCAVSEMWAYYLEDKFYRDRYGVQSAGFGSGFWFHPQILTQLESRGLSAGQIFQAFDSEITDVSGLKEKLIDLYPKKKTVINQVFNRYE